jgi:hypothetical protein
MKYLLLVLATAATLANADTIVDIASKDQTLSTLGSFFLSPFFSSLSLSLSLCITHPSSFLLNQSPPSRPPTSSQLSKVPVRSP